MQPKTWIALGALLAIGLGAWLTLRAPEKGTRQGPAPRPVAAFKAADVKTLDLTNAGKDHVTLQRDGTVWKMTAPIAATADQSLIKNSLDQLEKLSFGDIVTEAPEKQDELEVSPAKGVQVVAKDGAGKVLLDAIVGKSSSGFTMLRPNGKNEVWQASGLFKYTFAREPKLWRDHAIVDFAQDDVSKLSVTEGAAKIELERHAPKEKGKPATWTVLSSTEKVDPLDEPAPGSLLQSFATLRASDFADAATPASVGLDAPRMTITATVKNAPVTLLVGNTKGDDSWVQLAGRPQVYLLQRFLMERLAVSPRNFRDKTLVKAKADTLTEVDIQVGADSFALKREGAAWKSPKGELDDAKVKNLLGGFENLQGTGYALPGDKATGLAKPAGQVTVKIKDKPPVTLKIGALTTAQEYYLQRVGSPDVLLAKRFVVERVWKKLSELTKGATASK